LPYHFANIIDLGGCSLHHVANVAKHACSAADLGNKIEGTQMKDMYWYFKFSQVEPNLTTLLTVSQKLSDCKYKLHECPLCVQFSVVERVLNLYESLIEFFSKENQGGSN